MDNIVVPLIVVGAIVVIRPARRRAIAMGKASWHALSGVTAATVAGTGEVIRSAVGGDQRQAA